jgi:acetyl esterase/lipase
MRHNLTAIALAILALLVSASCGDDAPKQVDQGPVYASSAAEFDWTVEQVVYGTGISHRRDFNADASTTMDLVGDLYLPQGVDGTRPALLIVHGGGFIGGTRKQAELVEFGEYFAARGWVVLSIDYRLNNDYGTVPEAWLEMVEREETGVRVMLGKSIYPAVRDAKAAVRWLQANADTYQISPEHIAAMGGSAGAHASIALGVTVPSDFRDELTLEQDPTLETTNLDQSGEIAAVLDFWGGADAVEGVHRVYGGESRWDEDDAPVLIVHGNSDGIVPIEEGQEVRDAYEASGAAYQYVELDGAGHGAWEEMDEGQNLRELGEAFLMEQMGVVVRE